MDFNFLAVLAQLALFLLPIGFFFVAGAALFAIAWLLGSMNKHTVVVTVEHGESRVANEHSVNVFACRTETGEEITLQNSFSLYGWKFVKKTLAINRSLKVGGKYRLLVAGAGWGYGQNILAVEQEL